MTVVALTIAGSDPSGGAGLQADLKTFHQHGVYGMSVVTLVTVQNTRSVSAVEVLAPRLVIEQLDAVMADIPPAAIKTGALGRADVIAAVAARAAGFRVPLVVDPVMVSKHGAPLVAADAVDVLVAQLLPLATLVTPNLPEAARLAGFEVHDPESMEREARAIAALGPRHVLVKGGHLAGATIDLLWSDGRATVFPGERIDTPHTHGTGCTLSAAITARLARGDDVPAAVAGGDMLGASRSEIGWGMCGRCFSVRKPQARTRGIRPARQPAPPHHTATPTARSMRSELRRLPRARAPPSRGPRAPATR